MPLVKSSSKAARQKNICRLIDEGYPPMQAVAIAYSTQRAAKAKNRAGDPLAKLVTALRKNADAYHERRLDHDAFSRRNRYIWSQIEAMGEAAQDRALAMLRSSR